MLPVWVSPLTFPNRCFSERSAGAWKQLRETTGGPFGPERSPEQPPGLRQEPHRFRVCFWVGSGHPHMFLLHIKPTKNIDFLKSPFRFRSALGAPSGTSLHLFGDTRAPSTTNNGVAAHAALPILAGKAFEHSHSPWGPRGVHDKTEKTHIRGDKKRSEHCHFPRKKDKNVSLRIMLAILI